MTITCMHCGPVLVTDPVVALASQQALRGLAVGHAPLGGITCPRCNEEVFARDVTPAGRGRLDPWLCEGGER